MAEPLHNVGKIDLVFHIYAKLFCIFIASDHKTMVVEGTTYHIGEQMPGRLKSVRIFVFHKFDVLYRSNLSCVPLQCGCGTAKVHLHVKASD